MARPLQFPRITPRMPSSATQPPRPGVREPVHERGEAQDDQRGIMPIPRPMQYRDRQLRGRGAGLGLGQRVE